MRVICLASRKGGVGKTTLAAHLAVRALAEGRVAMLDTDPQGGLAGWWNAREAEAPEWVDAGRSLVEAVASARARGVATLIVDTPPSLSDSISLVMRFSDLIVVPCQPSPNDLRAVGATVELAEAAGKPMVFVINRATPRARITTQAAIALSRHGAVCPALIHSRLDFATSMTDGRTAGELDPTSKAAGEIDALWLWLSNFVKGTRDGKTRRHAA